MYNNPIASIAGAQVQVIDRTSEDFNLTFRHGKAIENVNLGSYNYLGFNQNSGPFSDSVEDAIRKYGISVGSSRLEFGSLSVHRRLERLMSQFLGVEDCITFGMGFATNVSSINTLFDNETLIISDEYNHASIARGCKLTGGVVVKFKHNDMKSLEMCLIDGIEKLMGHRRWKRIVILVEGVYSMEGTIVNLPEVIRLKKKYKAYLYLDEAHSIGALGKRGKGVVDFFGVDVKDVDILMGTFTKSFAAAGGYIAGQKNVIDYLRVYSTINCYATSMSPAMVDQIVCCVRVLMSVESNKSQENLIQKLSQNTKYLRQKLKENGFVLLGNDNSPAIPVMVFLPCKLHYFINQMKKRGVAAAAAGPPAIPLNELRARFCVSAAHSREMLDKALKVICEVGKEAFII